MLAFIIFGRGWHRKFLEPLYGAHGDDRCTWSQWIPPDALVDFTPAGIGDSDSLSPLCSAGSPVSCNPAILKGVWKENLLEQHEHHGVTTHRRQAAAVGPSLRVPRTGRSLLHNNVSCRGGDIHYPNRPVAILTV